MKPFITTLGNFCLQRLPNDHSDQLLPWNAADEYLINTLDEKDLLKTHLNILLINDQFGSLASALNQHSLQHWSDSSTSHHACRLNLEHNQLAPNIQYIASTDIPSIQPDIVLIKIPKSIDLLKDQLIRIKALINKETTLITAGMVKHISPNILKIFNHIIGTSTQSLAKKKARLIFTKADNTQNIKPSYPQRQNMPELGLELHHHANVFSKSKLDMGTRFLLQHFEQLPTAQHIVDLGCGNGVLGIMAKQQQPDSQITFIDESYMAIDSAKQNYASAINDESAQFIAKDELLLEPQSVDLVLCNPPFHHEHIITNHIAWQMFEQSHRVLRKGQSLWCVANRHLNYHSNLKHLFGNCKTIAMNKKFVILEATVA
ncbi:MAG: methyltransferase [Thiotrichaceae bacterium]|nr:methyltransferase [Thiotrichaceae bacterium]